MIIRKVADKRGTRSIDDDESIEKLDTISREVHKCVVEYDKEAATNGLKARGKIANTNNALSTTASTLWADDSIQSNVEMQIIYKIWLQSQQQLIMVIQLQMSAVVSFQQLTTKDIIPMVYYVATHNIQYHYMYMGNNNTK